jgi:hypothetical protein
MNRRDIMILELILSGYRPPAGGLFICNAKTYLNNCGTNILESIHFSFFEYNQLIYPIFGYKQSYDYEIRNMNEERNLDHGRK